MLTIVVALIVTHDFAGVEKQVKRHVWKWFAEQNVVVPWMVIGP